MITNVKKKNSIILFALLFLSFIFSVFILPIKSVNAESTEYSDVLEDLRKSANFKESDYVLDIDDYKLEVITVSESVNNELFVYVYQPSAKFADLRATSINMAYKEDTSLKNKIEELIYINSNGVFYKYLVKGYNVSNDSIREYEITSIYRKFNAAYGDKELGNSNTLNEIAFPVAKHFSFNTVNGQSSLTVSDLDYIKVEDMFVGFVRYDNPDNNCFFKVTCDSHFIAFSTDIIIAKLLEADVYYERQEITSLAYGLYQKKGDIIHDYAYLKNGQVKNLKMDGIISDNTLNHEWNRIQTIEEFTKNENFSFVYNSLLVNSSENYNLTKIAETELQNKKWVLRFCETSIVDLTGLAGMKGFFNVSNVSLLRFKFETDGVIYNLGVVSDKQTGSKTPVNEHTTTYDFIPAFKVVLALLLFVVVISILTPVVDAVSSVLRFVRKILLLPFKLIGKLFKKGKG